MIPSCLKFYYTYQFFYCKSSNDGFAEKSILFKQRPLSVLIVFVGPSFMGGKFIMEGLNMKRSLLKAFWKRMKDILKAAL